MCILLLVYCTEASGVAATTTYPSKEVVPKLPTPPLSWERKVFTRGDGQGHSRGAFDMGFVKY